MTEEKKPFTVSDRRHFTPEGEARTVEAEPAKPPPTPPPAKAPPPAAPSPSPAPAAVEDDDTEVPPHAYPLDFTGLLLSLGTQAAMLLGGGDPAQGGPPPDPEGARAFIGLLDILKEKTQGRRTPEEDQVLEDLLYQLRMEYVTRTQVKGA
jgi:uncharacterized protein DUF1844